jgi:hypothetical protein
MDKLFDIWFDLTIKVFLGAWYMPSFLVADIDNVGITLNGMKSICKS